VGHYGYAAVLGLRATAFLSGQWLSPLVSMGFAFARLDRSPKLEPLYDVMMDGIIHVCREDMESLVVVRDGDSLSFSANIRRHAHSVNDTPGSRNELAVALALAALPAGRPCPGPARDGRSVRYDFTSASVARASRPAASAESDPPWASMVTSLSSSTSVSPWARRKNAKSAR